MPGWLRSILDAVLPAACEACDDPLPSGHPSCLCVRCHAAMRPPPPPLCPLCGAPVVCATTRWPCPACVRHRPAYGAARAAALYLPAAAGLNPLAVAVQRLKYGARRPLADALGALLAARYPFGDGVVLVPVPLHRRRLRARGFNQAVLLARALGHRCRLPVAAQLLMRTRDTRAQPGLPAADRRRNLAGAFVVSDPVRLAGRHLVLIDDVLTTGATADACARVLLAAGAARVDVYTVGRAPIPDAARPIPGSSALEAPRPGG